MHREARGRRLDRRLPGGAEPDHAREQRADLGRPLVRVLFVLLWKFAFRASRRAWRTGPSGSARASTTPRRPRPKPRPSSRSTSAQLADAKNESARIIEEARQQADALKREREAAPQAELAAMRERAAADIEAAKAQAVADLRAEVAASPSVPPRSSCSTTSTRHADPARRELHQPGRGERVSTQDRIDGYADGALRGRAGGGLTSTRSRTSCSASPARSRATTSCATRSSTEPSRPRAARASSRSCSAARRRASRPHWSASWSGLAGLATCRRSSTSSSLALRPRSSWPSPRCASAIGSPTIRKPGSPRRSNKATGKKVELKVDRRSVGARRPRRTVGDTVIDGTVRTPPRTS